MLQNGFRLLTLIAWIAILFLPANSSDIGCNMGSFRMGTKCYDPYFDRATTFNNAQEICEDNDGTIALFENEEISEFLINIGIKYKYQSYAVDSRFRGCSSMSFENNYDIGKENCDNNIFFACEFGSILSNSRVELFGCHSTSQSTFSITGAMEAKKPLKDIDIGSAQNCSWHESKCYKLMYYRIPAREAITRCSKINGRIASVKNPGEQEFFKKLLQEDKWWKNVHEEEIKRNYFSDFYTFWSGKRRNGKCGIISYDSLEGSGDCEAHNHFFCEYKAAPDIVPNTSKNPTTHYITTTESTSSIGSTTSTLKTTSTLETTSTMPSTTSTLESTSTLSSTTTSSLEVTTDTDLATTTLSSATTSLESSQYLSSKELNQGLDAIIETEKSHNTTVQESKPEKEDSKTLNPIEFAIIGIMGGLFIIITIVIVQLFKLRKKLFSKYYKENKENQGPQALPLLLPSPTSPTIQQPQTTDHYLTPNTSIYSLPSDDTRDVYPIPINTRRVLHSNGPSFGFENNRLYGNSPQELQNVSRSSQEAIYTDHQYEEIKYNTVVIS